MQIEHTYLSNIEHRKNIYYLGVTSRKISEELLGEILEILLRIYCTNCDSLKEIKKGISGRIP